jgi:hypothetical protein
VLSKKLVLVLVVLLLLLVVKFGVCTAHFVFG